MIDPDNPICPACGGSHLDRPEVDIGVGTQYGPWECFNPSCGWSENDAGWWPSEQAEEMVGAINALFAEPIYEDGEKANGISVRFLMRMQMLKDAACMAEPNDPFVAEARAYFAAQAEKPA